MFEQNVPLKQISHYKIGGEAKYFFEAKNIDDLIPAVLKSRQLNEKIFILAGATNVLIGDEGFDGLIIKPDFQFIKKDSDYFIKVGSGTLMKNLINFSLENSLSGLEWAAGLPGTLGGAIRGNAGAFGKEIKDVVENVVSLDISQKNPQIIKRDAADCRFEYRSSIFKNQLFDKLGTKEIILEATLKLTKGDILNIEKEIKKNINYRFAKHPMDYPSLGSTFKNISLDNINFPLLQQTLENENIPVKSDPFPVIPAAYLISKAGLIGASIGGAMISPKHPNFIINFSEATSSDVKNLIQLTKNKIKEELNIELVEEIEYL